MALDPNIALQVRPFKMDSPINAMAQMYQLQGAQQANQLNAMQMAEYERARVEEEGARNFLTRADLKTPEARTELVTKFGKTGVALAKSLAEQEAAALKQKTDQLDYTTKVTDAAANIYGTVKDDASWQAAKPKLAALGGDPKTLPKTYDPDFVRREMLAATKVKDQLTLFAPKPKEVKRADGSIIFLDENPNSPSYGKEVLPAQATGMTPFQTESLNVNKGQLGLAQQKFAWEKANPGFEIKEAEDGSIVGVNKRTLQAVPVTLGGAAPTAVAGTGMPGERAAAPTTGTPLRGKGTALSESQSNAVAYGMRMKEANSILEDMAKKGTLRGANIESVPFIGESLGKALPSVLGGTSAAQQQVNQAKSNFITAVLRKESGAVISDSEFDREDRKYFPQANDSDKVIKQKENARKLAIKAMEIQAGPGGKNIQQLQPSVGGGVDLSNPLLK